MTARLIAIVLAGVFASGCSTMTVDTEHEGFDRTAYLFDFGYCSGAAALLTTYRTVEGAVTGSALGIHHVLDKGSTREKLIAGAVIGGVARFGAGTVGALKKSPDRLDNCLVGRGYRLKQM